MVNKSFLPNINLRVFRREKQDITLIYNCSELVSLCGNVRPKVLINGTELNTIIQKSNAKDTTSGDICVFIDYQSNNLNSEDKYNIEFRFPLNDVEFIQYYIEVEACGVIPSLKDNKNIFVQPFAYNPKSKRWIKPTLQEDENGNKLMVVDDEVVNLLKDIKELLKKKLK